MDMQDVLLVLDSAVRLATPLLLAALAGLYSERSGVFDIGLEGKMLMGAFAAGVVAALAGTAWLGLAAAIVVSIVLALVHGFASITQRGNQIVSGVAINFLAAGLTTFLGQAWFGQALPGPASDGIAPPFDTTRTDIGALPVALRYLRGSSAT